MVIIMNNQITKARIGKKIIIFNLIHTLILLVIALIYLYFNEFYFSDPTVFLVCLFIFCIHLPFLINTIVYSIRRKNNSLIIYNDKIKGSFGTITTMEFDIPISKIDNVKVTHSLLGKILGYGSIQINTPSENYIMYNIENCSELKETINQLIENK